MVKRISYAMCVASAVYGALLLSSCSDAGLIDTPRVIDTIGIQRTVVRSVDVTGDVAYLATVNGASSFVEVDPGTQVTLLRMSDSTWFVDANINVSNRSQVPFLPVDVLQLSLRSSPLPADTSGVIVGHSIADGALDKPSATVVLFRSVTSAIDFTDSTKVNVRVTRGSLSEQRTLNDVQITRTYDAFQTTDDTVLVPWDVFGIRDTSLAVDTSYAITTYNTGNRSTIENRTVEPPAFNAQPVQCLVETSTGTRPGKVQLRLVIQADGNSALTALLGAQGVVDLTLILPIP